MTTNALQFEMNRGQNPDYAPRDGRQTYGFSDVLGVLHHRMSRAMQQEDVLRRLELSAGIKSGYRTNLRNKIVAERAERMSIRLNDHATRMKEAMAKTSAQQSRLLQALEDHRKSKDDFLKADRKSSLEQSVVDDISRSKTRFVDTFDLPKEVLDPKKMDDFRRWVTSGTTTVPATNFSTPDVKCRSVLNATLGLQSQGSSWSIEQVVEAIFKLDESAAEADVLAGQLRTATEKADRFGREKYDLEIAAGKSLSAEVAKSTEEINRLEEELGEANRETKELKERVAELESQINDTVEAKEKAKKRVGDLESQLSDKSSVLESLQYAASPGVLETAEVHKELKKKLSEAEAERDDVQTQLTTEQEAHKRTIEEHEQLKESTATARQEMEAVKTKYENVQTERDDMRRQWVDLVQAIADTSNNTHRAIPEHVLRPLMFIIQRGPGVIEITSDDLQLHAPSVKQLVAVDSYEGFPAASIAEFNAMRILQVLLNPVNVIGDVIWLEAHAIPKVTRELGVEHGRPSTYVLMLYLAMQQRFLSATGLGKAVAASALAELHACFPLRDASRWVDCVQGLVQDDRTRGDESLLDKPLLDQASSTRLLATLGNQILAVQCNPSVRLSIVRGSIAVEHSIPKILTTLLELGARGPAGHSHVVVRDSPHRLIAIDDGGEEYIFVCHALDSWSCCASGFDFSHDGKLLEMSCAALPEFKWTDPELNNYVTESVRYCEAVANLKLDAAIKQGVLLNSKFRMIEHDD